ncbi:hypothetical protein ATCC90586_010135 [Pythium insidiosum]|nr:hypothetical protein ATCC90586_010135 [Pythium insidiosum]
MERALTKGYIVFQEAISPLLAQSLLEDDDKGWENIFLGLDVESGEMVYDDFRQQRRLQPTQRSALEAALHPCPVSYLIHGNKVKMDEANNAVFMMLEGLSQSVREVCHTVANQSQEFRALLMEQTQAQFAGREFKIPGAVMPNFWGKPSESFDSYVFGAKLYMKGCNIDYTRPENQARVVAIMCSGLRGGAASFLTHRLMIENLPIRDLDEFESVFSEEFVPSDQQQRLRAALRACRQSGSIEDYVARFREIIMQIRQMSQLDQVDHFIAGLKPETQKEVNYLNCETLRDAIAAAQAYERAHFGGAAPRRSRPARLPDAEPMDVSHVATRASDEVLEVAQFSSRPPRPSIEACRRASVSAEPMIFDMEEASEPCVVIGPSVCAMEIELDKVQVEGEGLLFVDVTVQDKKLRTLVDSGATHCIVRRGLLRAPEGASLTELRARDFEGKVTWTRAHHYDVTLLVAGKESVAEFVEWPLQQEFDGILGQTWLRKENPVIDWVQGRIGWPRSEVFHLDVVNTKGDVKLDTDIESLVQEFSDYLREELPDGLPPERDIEHSVVLKAGAKPSSRPPFRHAHVEQTALRSFVDKLLNKRWIEKSSSARVSNIFAVPKKDPVTGEMPTKIQWIRGGDPSKPVRWVIDYRYVNSMTDIPRIPIPRIDEVFDRLAGAHVFTLIDLASGYHQMRLAFEARQYTAFRAGSEIYQWCVAPMGLAGMPGTWSRLMRRIFETSELAAFVVVYLDDICVFSRSREEHLKHLRRVFEILREEKLFARPSKCHFAQSEIRFLGHIISGAGVRVDPDKTTAVSTWPQPQNAKDLQRFLGLAGYYRRFVRGYADLVLPLSDLLKAKMEWVWSSSQERAFTAIKAALVSAPLLRLPDMALPFQVTTDASKYCVGGVLSQVVDGYDHPIGFYSRKLSDIETRWPAHEQELYAIKQCLERWRCYLLGSHFIVFTDNSACRWFLSHANLSAKMTRWLEFFGQFDFELKHKKGESNVVADALSRPPVVTTSVGIFVFHTRFLSRSAKLLVEGNAPFGPSPVLPQQLPSPLRVQSTLLLVGEDEEFVRDVVAAYPRDKDCVTIIRALQRGDTETNTKYVLRDGLLYVKSADAIQSVVSDRDSKFTSEFWQELMRIMQVKHRMTVSRRAQADGRSERQSHLGPGPALNITRSRREIIEFVQKNLRVAQERQAKFYNRGRQDVRFERGDLVYVDSRVLSSELGQPDYDPGRDPVRNKMLPKWYGPFLVEERIGENAYRLALPHRYVARGRHATFNVDQLKESVDVPEIFRARQITKSAPRLYDEDDQRVNGRQHL